MIDKTWDNPGSIILNNPETNRVGKCKGFRSLSLVEYFSKIFRKMQSNQPYITSGNVVVLFPISGGYSKGYSGV